MTRYIALLRGINISGKNKISMPELKAAFWSFDRKQYAKANWWKKTAAAGIGEMITIRTANTLRKLTYEI